MLIISNISAQNILFITIRVCHFTRVYILTETKTCRYFTHIYKRVYQTWSKRICCTLKSWNWKIKDFFFSYHLFAVVWLSFYLSDFVNFYFEDSLSRFRYWTMSKVAPKKYKLILENYIYITWVQLGPHDSPFLKVFQIY